MRFPKLMLHKKLVHEKPKMMSIVMILNLGLNPQLDSSDVRVQ